MYDLVYLFIIFLSYSVLGYLVEVTFVSLHEKKVVFNRGFLLGPWLPIYGVGSILMVTLLEGYKGDIPVLFGMGIIICSVVEYFTSYVLEKIFKVRWWDYSNMKYNLEGRICLSNSILFGLGGVVLVQVVEPFYESILDSINPTVLIVLGIILILVFIGDLVTSVSVLFNIKSKVKNYNREDNTEEIKNMIYEKLKKHNYLVARVLKAFPKMEGLRRQEFEEFKKMTLKLNELKREMKKAAKSTIDPSRKHLL